ncbi:MAG: hypothetical protein JOY54_09025 [Acidobacteriaceae bacterium]|nr:hypothetical protein [Acidobacteriaceae bacterium]
MRGQPLLIFILSVLGILTGFQSQMLFGQQLVPGAVQSEQRESAAAPDLSSLKIVVIDGEDGVNIVKKKTAVQPVVEVHDKNNLPVAGIVINFTTPSMGPSAVFANGSRTLSLVTDSAGRAAVSGMHPVGVGAFHINVTANNQGQTVASTTIAQVNYATAAAAASAGAGGAAAAGGGISTGVIVAIAAIAAAAAVGIGVGLSHGGSSSSSPSGTIGGGTATVGAAH